jgi:hypothetical protein
VFHWQNGFYVERVGDRVRVTVRESGHVDAPVLRTFEGTLEEWCSVFLQAANRGETSETFAEALAVLRAAP